MLSLVFSGKKKIKDDREVKIEDLLPVFAWLQI